VTTIGILVIKRYEKWGKRNVVYFMCFAAGVLVSVSFLHIIPKSFEMNESAPIFLLIGFVSLHVLSAFLSRSNQDKGNLKDRSTGIITLIGIGLHSFIDGVVYSVTFNVSIFTGLIAAIGMVLHEFPEGIITFLLSIKGGFSDKKSSVYAFLAAALSTPLGTLVSFPFISNIEKPFLGILLATSAGALVYVGATHLLPEAIEEHKKHSLIAFFFGITVAAMIILTK